MQSQDSRGSGRRGRGGRRPGRGPRDEQRAPQPTPQKLTLWQRIVAVFKPDAYDQKPAAFTPKKYPKYESASVASTGTETAAPREPREEREQRERRKPEAVEVTTPKLYVGNLSYDTGESDLFDLFNGVGEVRNAEIVTHKETERSKGFGFVTMSTVDEAKRAVVELHDKDFMGRKLVVSGSKTPA